MAPAGVVAHPDPPRLSPIKCLMRLKGSTRAAGPSIAYGCRSARLLHQCAHHHWSLERMLVVCLFSSMADRATVAPPSRHQGLPSSACSMQRIFWYTGASLSRGSPPSRAAHPFDGDSFFVSHGVETPLYHRCASTSRSSSWLSVGTPGGGAVYLVTVRFLYWFSDAKERGSDKLDIDFAPPGFFSPGSVLTGASKVRSD